MNETVKTDKGQIPHQLGLLEQRLSELETVITTLIAELESALSKNLADSPGPEVERGTQGGLCPLAYTLFNVWTKMEQLTILVQDAKNRLEL
jgi:hypothetical protein